jgi:glyoxylase-like metal-dependent hydrolase (beta-lactamase superfamily II)
MIGSREAAPTREPPYEVLALRYGTVLSTRAKCFADYARYGEADAPMRMDFYVWLIRNETRMIVVDTGFDPDVGARRGRTCLASPAHALALAGAEPARVVDVVLTHLHYDHAGNLGAFPRAAFHLHRRELEFWRSARAKAARFAALVEPSELAAVESAMRAGRVRLIEGDEEIAPGVRAVWTGGHTPGQLLIMVRAHGSLVVLASDALHFDEELERDRPFAVLSHEGEMRAGYELLRELADAGATIVPGHDPSVMERFPRLGRGLAGVRVG